MIIFTDFYLKLIVLSNEKCDIFIRRKNNFLQNTCKIKYILKSRTLKVVQFLSTFSFLYANNN